MMSNVDELVAWIVGNPKLEEHILNGAVRGLYHPIVADKAIKLIREYNRTKFIEEVDAA